MSGHFIERCSCGVVLSQCRCPGPKVESVSRAACTHTNAQGAPYQAPSPETGSPERAAPPSSSAGLSAEEVVGLSTPNDIQWALGQARSHHFMVTTKHDAMGPRTQACSGCDESYPCPTKILATALEATAARLDEQERWSAETWRQHAAMVAEHDAAVEAMRRAQAETESIQGLLVTANEALRDLKDSLAERERELAVAMRAVDKCGELDCFGLKADRDALKEKLAAAERVVEAARLEAERHFAGRLFDAVADYDAAAIPARKTE